MLEPGIYAITHKEDIVVIDMRATPITFDRLPVTTLDGSILAASVTAKVQVTDLRLAVSVSRNCLQDAAVVLRDSLKAVINSAKESELQLQRSELKKSLLAGVDHILAGSDYPHQIGSIEKMLASIRAVKISEEDRARILGGNASKLLGL